MRGRAGKERTVEYWRWERKERQIEDGGEKKEVLTSSAPMQVGRLLASCTQFEKQEKLEMSEKVRKLLGSYHALKGRSGDSPGIRKHYTTLQTRWVAFEKEVQKLTANMELVKKFHQVLYEVSYCACIWWEELVGLEQSHHDNWLIGIILTTSVEFVPSSEVAFHLPNNL